jgi:hypothetical protein
MAQRTDIHRPGAIIPANYEQWNDYALASAGGVPAMGIDCAQPYNVYDGAGRFVHTVHPACHDSGRCCVASTERHCRRDGRAVYGAAGRCGVCGARFIFGTMFRHAPTGEIVHMGHDCARKYEILADWATFDLGLERARKVAAKITARAKGDQERQDFLDAHPGLADAFTVEHRIISDIKERFAQWRMISDKQVALVLKLANEVRNPVARPTEINVAAPIGRVAFTGEIVSAKIHSGDYGDTIKITIKVSADGGCWLAWLTAPQELCNEIWNETKKPAIESMRGRTVTITATLSAGREAHFAFGKRPTLGAPKAKAPRKSRKASGTQASEPELASEADAIAQCGLTGALIHS